MKKSMRKKNEQNKRRFEAIKNLMSTFAMSTVAVVAVVVLIPASPKAEISKAVALSEEITYNVTVTDEENALDLSTLFVVLENQLEYYEEPLSMGQNVGYFENLQANTTYRLSVYGSKGFGQERLDTLMITTKERIGATILAVTPINTDYATNYLVDIVINDPEETYTSFTLYYGYTYEHDSEVFYSSIPITESRMSIELNDIYTTEDIHIYIEGTTLEGTEILDEVTISPPFVFYASLYSTFINQNAIGFSLYSDVTEHIRYEMRIYQNNQLIQTYQPTITQDNYEHNSYTVDGLSPNTLYYITCTAIYQNPQTLREEQTIIYEQELTTLSTYSYTYTIETFDEYMEIIITVDDPSHYFQLAYFEVYDLSEEYDMYINSQTISFVPDGTMKTATFTIPIPTTNAYKIKIGIRSQNDYTIDQTIEVLINE